MRSPTLQQQGAAGAWRGVVCRAGEFDAHQRGGWGSGQIVGGFGGNSANWANTFTGDPGRNQC